MDTKPIVMKVNAANNFNKQELVVKTKNENSVHFEFYRNSKGAYHYQLTGNSETLFNSPGFTTQYECNKRLQILLACNQNDMRKKKKITTDNKCVFLLRVKGLTVGISQPFNEVIDCRKLLARVMKLLAT